MKAVSVLSNLMRSGTRRIVKESVEVNIIKSLIVEQLDPGGENVEENLDGKRSDRPKKQAFPAECITILYEQHRAISRMRGLRGPARP